MEPTFIPCRLVAQEAGFPAKGKERFAYPYSAVDPLLRDHCVEDQAQRDLADCMGRTFHMKFFRLDRNPPDGEEIPNLGYGLIP